jgi:excisionase family DNA binding protein
MTGNEEWLSTKDAAERIGVTPRTLYRFIDEGDLPAYKFGRVSRARADELHRPGQIQEHAVVIEAEIGQILGEVGKVVPDADLQMIAEVT